MFLKRERPETDDFVRKKSGSKEKCFQYFSITKNKKSFSRHPYTKMSLNRFAYSCFSEHSKHFFIIFKKKKKFECKFFWTVNNDNSVGDII